MPSGGETNDEKAQQQDEPGQEEEEEEEKPMPLIESCYVHAFSYLELDEVLAVLGSTKRFRFLTDPIYFSELFGRHLAPPYDLCSSYEALRSARNDLVALFSQLKAASVERGPEAANEQEEVELWSKWFPLEEMCQTVEAQFARDPRVVDRVLFALSLVLRMSTTAGENCPTNLLAAVPRGSTLQHFFLGDPEISAQQQERQTLEEQPRWTRRHCVECVATRLAAFVRRLPAQQQWTAIHTNPAARATPGEYTATSGRHVVEPGLEFLASLQSKGYDRGLVENALHRCTMHVFRRFCPQLLVDHAEATPPAKVLHACRLNISRRSRFEVLPLLTKFLFKQAGAESVEEGEDAGLGLVGAPPDRYYDVECSFLDRVVEQGFGIPLSLCALLCMAAARVGLGGVHMLNLPGHVQCGLLVRTAVERATGQPGEAQVFRLLEFVITQAQSGAFENGRCIATIDCFEGGRVEMVKAPNTTPNSVRVLTMPPASAISMWIRAINNITQVGVKYTDGTADAALPPMPPMKLSRVRLQAQSLAYLLHNIAISFIGENDEPDAEKDLGREMIAMSQAAHLGLLWPLHQIALRQYPPRLRGPAPEVWPGGGEADPKQVPLQALVSRVCLDEEQLVEDNPDRQLLNIFRACFECARAAERQSGWC